MLFRKKSLSDQTTYGIVGLGRFGYALAMELASTGADLIVLDTVAELFDLPADLVAGLPHLEMMGSRQLYLEHHTGILAYSDEQIDVNTTGGVLRVRGARLALMAMTAEELRIGGDIAAVEWVR